jgi:hypothetical protein
MADPSEDRTAVDFFRDGRVLDDPYPFYEALRDKCPVSREDRAKRTTTSPT